ncbi:substrate-binding domain-containing protein [Vibrio sp. JC009]|uniref:substrate-binding domain-containing protein n=1 Tax=Vibrio sp. JC009 TaxID=2912314 RepID=UPI0023B109E3|nr:substrate-binding domain-containing protein [Vibrio sp. JC009]WED20567.1 substrate-binding domain-containing protein [Vibrio sp. JC009]
MKKLLGLILTIPFLASCEKSDPIPEQKPQLLVYCGITMAHPITEIAKIVEKEKNVEILISQGGSEDLYKSLASSKKGDLYLPGSASYREKHIDEGLLGDFVHVGYNQAVMLVKKGNPLGIKSDLNELTRNDLSVVIGNADTGSIGRETKKILDKQGNYSEVLQNAVYVTTDSRNLNKALREGDADVIMNWRATAFFDENREFMDILDLDSSVAKPKKLLLNQLTFSKYPEISAYFMELAASEKGQEIFRNYGFIDNSH